MDRNLGFISAIMVFFCAMYLLATEKIPAHRSKGEVLILRRGTIPKSKLLDDEEAQNLPDHGAMGPSLSENNAQRVEEIPVHGEPYTTNFLWDGLNYDVKVKDGSLRILDSVDGWVKPGTLTALMVLNTCRDLLPRVLANTYQ
jgi:ATP-binding cassette, subfamily G (WHITE), member 2, PDR